MIGDCRPWYIDIAKKEVEPRVPTNADRMRGVSNETLAREILFFCPSDAVFTDGKPHYTGLSGKYFVTAEEAIADNLAWLQQPAKEEV